MPKILIVDDDRTLRVLFGKRLQHAGFDVYFAADGAEGLSAAAEICPDLIILDYQMPIMDGDEMLRRLRQSGRGQATKVILVTAATSHQTIPGIDEADLALYKPVSTIELVTTVNRLLSQSA